MVFREVREIGIVLEGIKEYSDGPNIRPSFEYLLKRMTDVVLKTTNKYNVKKDVAELVWYNGVPTIKEVVSSNKIELTKRDAEIILKIVVRATKYFKDDFVYYGKYNILLDSIKEFDEYVKTL